MAMHDEVQGLRQTLRETAARLEAVEADKQEAEEGLKMVADLLVEQGIDWYTGPHDGVGKLIEQRDEARQRAEAMERDNAALRALLQRHRDGEDACTDDECAEAFCVSVRQALLASAPPGEPASGYIGPDGSGSATGANWQPGRAAPPGEQGEGESFRPGAYTPNDWYTMDDDEVDRRLLFLERLQRRQKRGNSLAADALKAARGLQTKARNLTWYLQDYASKAEQLESEAAANRAAQDAPSEREVGQDGP